MMQMKDVFETQGNKDSKVKKVIAVGSGKGGVGKSSITAMLAVLARKMGKKVGIIDADITGPSIPKAFGVSGRATGTERGINPMPTKTGIEIMSLNLLVEDETSPVIWRAPLINSTIKQFWQNVVWGEKDIIFVDMPPGTGDVSLTVFQSLPVDGFITVTSPQDLVGMIVEKSVKMAEKMDIPLLAIIQNMSGFICPDCGKHHNIFGESNLEEIAQKYNIELTAKIPITEQITKACDTGTIEDLEENWLKPIVEKITPA